MNLVIQNGSKFLKDFCSLRKISLEIKRELFRVKNEIFNEIAKRAKIQIEKLVRFGNSEELKSQYYNQIFYNLLKEACRAIGESEVIVQANERDLEWLSANKSRVELRISEDLGFIIKIHLHDRPINSIGGVIVYSKDMRKYYVNTIESRFISVMEKYRNTIGLMIKSVLKKYLGGELL